MTDEEIRIKVAGLMGWVQIWKRQCGHNLGAPGAFDWVGREKTGGVEYVLPNYPADLNACAEFEATMTDDEWTDYLNQLYFITFKPGAKDRDRQAVSAAARQRCLAYLKTKGILP